MKVSVNDSSLDYLGMGKISVNLTSSYTSQWTSIKASKMKVVGNGTINIGGTSPVSEGIINGAGVNVEFSAGQYVVLFDYYYCAPLTLNNLGVTLDTKYMSHFQNISFSWPTWGKSVKGDVGLINGVAPVHLLLGNNEAQTMRTGEAADFVKFAATMTELNISFNTLITGNIADFGPCVNLTTLNISNTGVTGSLEGFVAAQRAAGRTTCNSLSLPYIGEGQTITFNGAKITTIQYTNTLSWTANTITFNGTTITA